MKVKVLSLILTFVDFSVIFYQCLKRAWGRKYLPGNNKFRNVVPFLAVTETQSTVMKIYKNLGFGQPPPGCDQIQKNNYWGLP